MSVRLTLGGLRIFRVFRLHVSGKVSKGPVAAWAYTLGYAVPDPRCMSLVGVAAPAGLHQLLMQVCLGASEGRVLPLKSFFFVVTRIVLWMPVGTTKICVVIAPPCYIFIAQPKRYPTINTIHNCKRH